MIICKYKFDSSIYTNLIPEFNSGYTGYTVSDEIDGNIVTRTITSESKPTYMRFGVGTSDSPTNRELSLLEVIELDTTELTSCKRMFIACQNVTNINTEGWTLNKVTNMYAMFYKCNLLNSLDVSNFDTTNVTDMHGIFYNCYSLTSLDVSNFDTSNVTNMFYMFRNCYNVASLDVSNFDTSNVTDMAGMFSGCESLTSLDLSNFDTSNVVTMYSMFNDCNSLVTLDISNFSSTSLTNSGELFTSVPIKYIKCNNKHFLPILSEQLPTQQGGTIVCKQNDLADVNTSTLQTKGWVIDNRPPVLTKFKFNPSLGGDYFPMGLGSVQGVFTEDYIDPQDIIVDTEGNRTEIITRTIESYNPVPELRFGRLTVSATAASSLLEVLELNHQHGAIDNFFTYCSNLRNVNLDGLSFSSDTSFSGFFRYCSSLGSVDINSLCKALPTHTGTMFDGCTSLSQIEGLESLNLSNSSNSVKMFSECHSLESLDLSAWNVSNTTKVVEMFAGCTSLETLDLSNWDLSKATDSTNFLSGTSIPDIGALNCNQETLTYLSNQVPLNSETTIWTNEPTIDLPIYTNVHYRRYSDDLELNLTSPLLEGDKIVKKDGKIYHYHKMGKVVLDGSDDEDWYVSSVADGDGVLVNTRAMATKGDVLSKLAKSSGAPVVFTNYDIGNYQYSRNDTKHWYFAETMDDLRLFQPSTYTIDSWKERLAKEPMVFVYELATPYYELISEDKDLSLTLPSADNILTNNSLIPTNMNIKNNSMSTVGISNSSTYTVVFDKDTDNNIVVNLNGTSIETSDNRVEITTSNELRENELTFIGEGEISNVRILDGSVSGDNIPRESFEGLKSSFEDGYIPSEEDNLAITKTIDEETITSWYESTTKLCPLSKIKPNIDYTLIYNLEILSTNSTAYTDMDLTTGITSASGNSQYFSCKNGLNIIKFKYGEKPFNEGHEYIFIRPLRRNTTPVEGEYVTYRTSYIYLFEGDWTHLTVEDFNHLGQYKVEYKVTGKNKININKVDVNSTGLNITVEGDTVSAPFSAVYQDFRYYVPVKRNTNYYFTIKSKQDVGILAYYGKVSVGHEADVYIDNVRENQVIKVNSGDYDFFTLRLSSETIHSGTIICNQLMVRESVDDSYEPYKEYTKTFYLNSPLLEGDTIEDINGVATHVKRYGKVVLDGSSDEIWGNSSLNSITSNTTRFYFNFNSSNRVYPQARILTQDEESIVLTDSVFSDNFRIASANITAGDSDTVVGRLISLMDNASELRFVIPTSELSTRDLDGFRQWLSNNPTTVVYELLTPQYETISNESILCDSYVNGHLDFDSATPVEKVDFRYMFSTTKYSIPSTKYIVQFESDDAGKLDMLHYAGTTFRDLEVIKGLNTFSITSSSSSTGSNAYFSMRGIGFNASNIQVVATARDNIKYFKGMESSFEDKVIRNKNLFNKNNVMFNNVINETGEIIYNTSYCRTEFIECKPNTPYTCNVGTGINYFDENKTWLGYQNHSTLSPSNAKYLIKCINHVNTDLDIVQIEEGIESTTYEEYNIYNGKYEVKITLEDENGVISNESIYLNSPLLKGDRIEMYNGKLCHYHKMGKIVLDGSEDEEWKGDSGVDSLHTWRFYPLPDSKFQSFMKSIPYSLVYSDNLPYAEYKALYENEMKGISVSINGNINIRNAISSTVQEFKAWLQANPTTVVYELAEPYYEEITPEHNEFTIVSIGESSFTIDSGNVSADGEVTYNVNVKLLNDLEENMNSNTSSTNVDLTTILDDIINE